MRRTMAAMVSLRPRLLRNSMARTLLLANGRSKMLKKKSQWIPIRKKRSRKSFSPCMRMRVAKIRMQRVMLVSA